MKEGSKERRMEGLTRFPKIMEVGAHRAPFKPMSVAAWWMNAELGKRLGCGGADRAALSFFAGGVS